MPFGFRPYDLIVIAIIALVFFGPKKLPEIGASFGKTIKEFQKSMREVTHPDEARTQQSLPTAAAQPVPAPQIAANVPASVPTTPATEAARETVTTSNASATTDHSND